MASNSPVVSSSSSSNSVPLKRARYLYSFGINLFGELGRGMPSSAVARRPDRIEFHPNSPACSFPIVAVYAGQHCSLALTGTVLLL